MKTQLLLLSLTLALVSATFITVKPHYCVYDKDKYEIIYYDTEPIKSPHSFPIIIMNNIPNQLIEVNITTSWKNISYMESEYKGWEDLLWFPVPQLHQTTGNVTIISKLDKKNATTNKCVFTMKFSNSSITPVIPPEIDLERQLIHGNVYTGVVKGKFRDSGDINFSAESKYPTDPQSVSPCKFEGSKKLEWRRMVNDAKISDVMKYAQVFEYYYRTSICGRNTEINTLRIKDIEYKHQSTGGCGAQTTDYFTSREAWNATFEITHQYLCRWDQLYGDCLVPKCSSPLLTIVLVIGLILLSAFIIGFIGYVFVIKRMRTNYETINQ